jgi:hypothetical protein
MGGASYIDLFSAWKAAAFSRLPLIPKKPVSGQSWSVAWRVKNGDLVRKGQKLARLDADTGRESYSMASPAPGRIHIDVPDGRYVSYLRPLGELEFGDGFTPPSLSTSLSSSLQSAESRLKDHRGRLRKLKASNASLRREIEAMEALIPKREKGSGPVSIHTAEKRPPPDLPRSFRDLLRLLIDLLANAVKRPDRQPPLTANDQGHLFSLASVLSDVPECKRGFRSGSAGSDPVSVINRLYFLKMEAARKNSLGLPPEIQREKWELWDELREIHVNRLNRPSS